MTTGRAEAEKSTIVWCLAFADNMTVISGDSRGKLTFWDSKIGAQLESYQSHKSDILAMCLSKDQTNLFCAGIDPNVHTFVKIEVKGGKEKWVRSMHRKFQDHDIRSLVLKDDILFSGGSSAYLMMQSERPNKSVQYPPILQNPVVSLSTQKKCILLRHSRHIEVWNLANGKEVSENITPKKIMSIHKTTKNHEKVKVQEGITFASISDDGMWIAYGTETGLRVFQFINVSTILILLGLQRINKIILD